jgi:hypothetical protein
MNYLNFGDFIEKIKRELKEKETHIKACQL